MSDHLTEEEQLEALKRWWKENGKFIVLAVVVSVGGYFGWGAWQDHQRTQAEAASMQYEELLESLLSEDRELASELVDQIKQTQGASLYAYNAAFIQAKAEVNSGDLEAAAEQLEWILEQKPGTAIEQLARLRLARVLAAQSSFEAALNLLQAVEPTGSFSSEYAEVRGDILLQQGEPNAALVAYETAITGLTAQQQNRAMLLQMKIDNLKTASADQEKAAPEENAS